MSVILYLGIFWVLYGLAGLCGFQVIGERYKGHEWTKDYVRQCGATWVLLGAPMLALYFWASAHPMDTSLMLGLILACGTPAVVASVILERKYKHGKREG